MKKKQLCCLIIRLVQTHGYPDFKSSVYNFKSSRYIYIHVQYGESIPLQIFKLIRSYKTKFYLCIKLKFFV